MKYIKSYLLAIIALIVFDQTVKLIIYHNFFHQQTDIFGHIIRFHPIINIRLSWAGNFVSIFSNIVFIVLVNILVIVLFIFGYAYYRSIYPLSSLSANIIYVTGLAGSICSLIDKLFWDGSLDFIQIPTLFTFDTKDCYISIAEVLFLLNVLKLKDFSMADFVKWCFRKK